MQALVQDAERRPRWLDTHVGHAVAGLVETAGGRGKLADAAIDYLRSVKRQGHEEVIAAALKKVKNADAAGKVQREVLDHEEKTYEPLTEKTTPDWLKKALAAAGKVKAQKLPGWAAPANLPPLPIGERRLNDEQLITVLNFLAATPVGQEPSASGGTAGARRTPRPRRVRLEAVSGLERGRLPLQGKVGDGSDRPPGRRRAARSSSRRWSGPGPAKASISGPSLAWNASAASAATWP